MRSIILSSSSLSLEQTNGSLLALLRLEQCHCHVRINARRLETIANLNHRRYYFQMTRILLYILFDLFNQRNVIATERAIKSNLCKSTWSAKGLRHRDENAI